MTGRMSGPLIPSWQSMQRRAGRSYSNCSRRGALCGAWQERQALSAIERYDSTSPFVTVGGTMRWLCAWALARHPSRS